MGSSESSGSENKGQAHLETGRLVLRIIMKGGRS